MQNKKPVPQLNINNADEAKLHNIIDMGLNFSAMMRLLQKGSKQLIKARTLTDVCEVFKAESEPALNEIHAAFCDWGVKNIVLAERRKKGRIIKKSGPVSYGQIAKILDVVLRVVVYYSHLPDSEKSHLISRWLHAAVDTKMMEYLKKDYSEDSRPWPKSIEQVHRAEYRSIQEAVRKFIGQEHSGEITPVQFDDIYWEALNKQKAESGK